MQSFFRTKTEQISKAVAKLTPSSLTGYLAPLAGWIKEQNDAPTINFNGQRLNDPAIYSNIQNGVVMRMKDPKGGREAHTVLNPRLSQHLLSNDAGKLNILGSDPNSLTLLDTIHSGNKFDSPIVVGMLRFAAVTQSTTLTSQDVAAVPDTTQVVNQELTQTPKTSGSGLTLSTQLNMINTGALGNPTLHFEFDPNFGLRQKEINDLTNFAGTNARTGTTLLGDDWIGNSVLKGSGGR